MATRMSLFLDDLKLLGDTDPPSWVLTETFMPRVLLTEGFFASNTQIVPRIRVGRCHSCIYIVLHLLQPWWVRVIR